MHVSNHIPKDASLEVAVQPLFRPRVDLRSAAVIGVQSVVPSSLTEEALDRATRAAGDWWQSGLHLQLSVSLSADILLDTGWRLDELVAEKLGETGLPGIALQFELPGEALMDDPEKAGIALGRLTEIGAAISIDSFGIGYFSLHQMHSLRLEELKVDRSLISGLFGDGKEKAILRSAIHLAHQLGLRVAAEGVETDAIWRRLQGMGCDRAQGSLIADPLPARQVPAWLAAWSHRARGLRSSKRALRVADAGIVPSPPA